MRIRTRVKIGGALTICVLLAYGALVLYLDRTMGHLAQEVRESHAIVNKIEILRSLTQDYLLYRTERAQRQWFAVYDEVLRLLQNPEYRVLKRESGLGDAPRKIKLVGDTFSRLMTMQPAARPDNQEWGARGELQNRLATQLLLATQDLRTRFTNLTETVNEKMIATQRFTSFLDILALSLLGILLISNMAFLRRSVVKPILKLHEGAEIIGAGNLDYKVGIASRDEIGQLSQAFDRMTANLQQVTVSRDELAKEIEDRKQAEKALRESREDLNRAQGVAHIGSWRLDMLRNELTWSDETYRIFRIPLGAALTYEMFLAAVLPEDRGYVDQKWTAALGGEPYDLEHRILAGDEVKWVREKAELEFDQQGRLLGGFGTVQDITERKQTEAEIKHLASFPEINPNPVLELDLSGTVTYYNQAALASLEKLGPEAGWADILPKDLGEITAAAQEKKTEFYYREVRVKDKVYSQNIYLAEPFQVLRIYCLDITPRKQAEERLQRTLIDLERSNQDLEEFAYVASHDLQEPLRKMANFSEMLANLYQGQLDDRADKCLGYIADGAKRMKLLINDLLAFSRVSRADFRLVATDMNDILRETLNDIQPLVRENQAKITHAALPTLKINAPQMRQLLQNLITNAIKFHGDQPPRINLSARQEEQEWVVAIRDHGIGIEPQYAEGIFKVFRRLHTQEEYPGTGIGLAICKKIVERHSGRIWVESQPGQGSTFYFTIPA